MTKSEMFKEAHARAKADMAYVHPAYPNANNYAYYFRLQLINLQAIERDSKASLVIGFQVVEPRRLWA